MPDITSKIESFFGIPISRDIKFESLYLFISSDSAILRMYNILVLRSVFFHFSKAILDFFTISAIDDSRVQSISAIGS